LRISRAQSVGSQALIKSSQLDSSPFIIGLTGHTDLELEQIPLLVDTVVRFLLEIKQHLPDTHVRVMLDACNQASLPIARALVALNMSVDALVDALGSDANAMKELLQHPQVGWIEGRARGSTLGDVLIRRGSLLLALWDGRSSSVPDDTADHVFRFLGVDGEQSETLNRIEISTVVNDLDVTARLVFWVPARRAVNDASENEQQPYYLLSAGDNVLEVQHTMPASLKRRLSELNEYNFEFERFTADGSLIRSASLIPANSENLAISDASILENIDRQFIKADSLAGYMQQRSDRLFNTFGIAAFTMGLAYLVYDKITESKILLMFYILILFISLVVYYFFQTKRWFGKYLSYRALAETLRVRFYLALAGVDRRMHTRELIALTGIYRFPGFGWISFALDSIEPTGLEPGDSNENAAVRGRLVEQAWIEDQYRYFLRKVATMQKHRFWIGRLKSGVFLAGLIVLSAMFMFGEALDHVDMRTGLPLKNVLTFCSGSLAVLLGVWELRQNKMALQELLWQYRNQLSQFQRARIQLQRITSRVRRDEILKELGEKSLMEIYLWAIHRYHREHAPPGAH
jgi:hypothetical protein